MHINLYRGSSSIPLQETSWKYQTVYMLNGHFWSFSAALRKSHSVECDIPHCTHTHTHFSVVLTFSYVAITHGCHSKGSVKLTMTLSISRRGKVTKYCMLISISPHVNLHKTD